MFPFINEVLLVASIFVIYSIVLAALAIFREKGLYLMTIICTIAANIEVLILVNAFGMEMTLGNVLFSAMFLTSDIASELYGKKVAKTTVLLGIAANIIFLIISQSWMLYIPNENDFAHEAIKTVFSNTPRLIIASLSVYVVCQLFDVWAYHKWWEFTTKKFGDSKKFLWLRNNGSTLISQLINTVLFNFAAFLGTYSIGTIISIIISCYLIFIITALADTPFVYLARLIHNRQLKREKILP